MQNADDRNKPSNLEAVRRAFDAVLRPAAPTPYQPDPNQRIRFREATRRMGFWPAEYKKALKAQTARDMRGEVTHGPRLPESFKDNGVEFFFESQILDGVRGNKKRAAQLASGVVQLFPLTGNLTLLEAIRFVGLGKSTAYHYGIVPEYDASGKRKHTNRVAPFPWLPMPDSMIRSEHGRKLFFVEEIHAWRDAMRARSRQVDETNDANIRMLTQREDS